MELSKDHCPKKEMRGAAPFSLFFVLGVVVL
jgi:hypothetical protein